MQDTKMRFFLQFSRAPEVSRLETIMVRIVHTHNDPSQSIFHSAFLLKSKE